ncbi:hypothetical protein ACFV84_06710, partial [Kitasatospora sp. NPDC059811]|uniref:hypothetical protein n=1 Tax=Kitasatospora sp. NPDC059811 TaxID=3346957 RepID=UPI0036460E21
KKTSMFLAGALSRPPPPAAAPPQTKSASTAAPPWQTKVAPQTKASADPAEGTLRTRSFSINAAQQWG